MTRGSRHASFTSLTEGSKLSSSDWDRRVNPSPLQEELADLAHRRAGQLVHDLDADRSLGLGEPALAPPPELFRVHLREARLQNDEPHRHLVAHGVGLADD